MNIRRIWAQPSSDTFDVPPIGDFVKQYLRQCKGVSVDPFARNKRWCTYTNDLNPNTAAEYHMDAEDFLKMLRDRGVVAELVIFDPPYSPRQISECYQGIGRTVTTQDTQNSALYARVRRIIYEITRPGSVVLSFGWNSHGMSNSGGHGWDVENILMVCHGGAHNDTICMAERKQVHQPSLMFAMEAA